ncbi:polysaccharide pyruvyl transferase family protein [Isoptericola sp. NPDC057391]|uniref:polysaccharide pyruvyl transferase family protein n=1 Tax=Isoptericola sp. NPDC057391 TaxID=3346117 RepID=UPI003640A7C0
MTARVALLGEAGIANVGNDASVAQVIRLLEERDVDVRVTLVGREPAAARAALGRPALAARARWAYRGPLHASVPAQGLRACLDLAHLVRLVRRFDAVVVPGTGALEVGRGGPPGGQILSILLTGVACRLTRTPFVWLAVGGSRYSRRVTRAAVRAAAATATIRSYRDPVTLEAVRACGTDTSRDVLMDDIVTARSDVLGGAADGGAEGGAGVVVLSLVDVPSATGESGATAAERRRYQHEMSRVLGALLDRGTPVRVVVSDAADVPVARRVVDAVAQDGGRPRVQVRVPRDFDELSGDVADARAVVGSRFHVLVAAALRRVPFVTVEHADKVRVLSDDAGVGSYRVDAHAFGADELLESLDALLGKREALARDLDAWAVDAHRRTRSGYDEVLARLREKGVVV